MSRKLVYVNAISETVTLESAGSFTIVKVDGLGMPETMMQEQKAPFQDGTTYIDALFQPRTITVEIAITKPNDFASIDTLRRELSRKLNPKLGQGTLTYTTEGGQSYKITAIPISSPAFPNKDYRDPYPRAQITFYCNDPYWQSLSSTTITLPTPTITSATVVGAASTFPSALLAESGDIVLAYIRSADSNLVSKTYSGGAWGSEVVINNAASIYSALAQKSNGTIIAIYQRTADHYLVYREYVTSWGAETVLISANSKYPSVIFDAQERVSAAYIRDADNYFVWSNWAGLGGAEATVNGAASNYGCLIQKSNGNLFAVYVRTSDGYLVSREYTTSWSAETVIDTDGVRFPVVIEKANGNLFLVYQNTLSEVYSREFTTSWSAKSAKIADADTSINATSMSLIQSTNGNLMLIYRNSPGALIYRIFTTVWTGEGTITAAGGRVPSVIQKSDGSYFLVYRRISDNYLVSKTATEPSIAWSSETVINSAASNYLNVIQKSNGNMLLFYTRDADTYLVSREYDGSWGAESVVNAANTEWPSCVEKANGDLAIMYLRKSDSYIVTRGPALVETVINGASTLSGQVIHDGTNYKAIYARNSDGYIVSRTYTVGWSAETVLVSAASTKPSATVDTSGRLVLIYLNASSHLIYNIYENGAWGSPITLVASACDDCYIVATPGNSIFVVYQRGADDYLLKIESGITPVLADVTGDYETPMAVTFIGPSTNPRIIKASTLEYIKLNLVLAAGDSFVVNTAFGQKTVVLTQNGVVSNGAAYLDIGSTFFQLDMGDNTVYFEDDAVTSTASATMTWTERYVGV